jgi:hypothetical protein
MAAKGIENKSLIEGPSHFMILESNDGTPARVRLRQTPEAYQAFLNEGRSSGFRPSTVSAYWQKNQLLFNVVLIQDKRAVDWQERHGLTAGQLHEWHGHWTARGYRPACFSGYADGNESRYVAVWIKEKAASNNP